MSFPTYHLTDKDVLYFLHIQKTAGISLADMIREQFAPDEIHPIQQIHTFLETPPEVIAKYKFVEGHYYYNIAPFVPGHHVYITLLRDPVELTISYYAQLRRWVPFYAYNIVKSQSLLEYLKDPRMRGHWVNFQTRHFAIDMNIPEMAAKLTSEQLENLELERLVANVSPNGFEDPALLPKAQERLSKFAFVGLTERFDDSVEVLYRTFGWPIPEKKKMLNIGANRPEAKDIPQEAIDLIREHTQLDAALYATGKKMFEERYQQMASEFGLNEKPAQPIDLDQNSVASLKRQIEYQQTLIDQLKQDALDKITFTERLHQIETSFGWRFVLRMHDLRSKLIPEGSAIEDIYLKLRGR